MDRFSEIRAKRERARRARQLAWSVTDNVIRSRMLAFAEDLDAEADALAGQPRSVPPRTGLEPVQ